MGFKLSSSAHVAEERRDGRNHASAKYYCYCYRYRYSSKGRCEMATPAIGARGVEESL